MSAERFPRIRRVFRFRNVERDVEDELSFHFDRTVDELMHDGMPRPQAEAETRRRFGDESSWRMELGRIDRRTEALRSRAECLARVGEDVRQAFRGLRRSPGLTAGVVLTFGLGIGANATMFGIIDRLLLRPPAHVVDADGVKRLIIDRRLVERGTRLTNEWLTFPMYEDFRRAGSFSSVAAFANWTLTIGRGESARPVAASLVTGEFFSLLGVDPVVGRFFGPARDRPDAPGVAVISFGLWQRRFGGERSPLGETVDFGYGPYTIVGVAPAGFTGANLGRVDLWIPARTAATAIGGDDMLRLRGRYWLSGVVVRLAPGATPRSAMAEATALHRRGQREWIEDGRYDPAADVIVAPLIAARGPMASSESVVAKWLAGVSMLVLLIACANVANLLLARSIRLRRETGIRLALGVTRGRLLGQKLTESLMLAVLGGAGAILVARWGGNVLRSALLPDIDWTGSAAGSRVALFSLILALMAGVVSGMIPAMQSIRPDVVGTLRSGSRTVSPPGTRTRSVLTALQAMLSVVLLVGAGLFVRSLHGARTLDLGIELDGLLLAEVVDDEALTNDERAAFWRRAALRVSTLPEVDHAAAAVGIPFLSALAPFVTVPGLDSIQRIPGVGPYLHSVGAGYFDAVGLRILRGRGFEGDDGEGGKSVAVVNETMARALWPGEDALGKCLIIGEERAPCAAVVGIVEDVRGLGSMAESKPEMQYYVPLAQRGRRAPHGLLIRSTHDPNAVVPAIRRALLALDPRVRYAAVRRFADLLAPQTRAWELGAAMFTAFALLALVVAGIGLYSVLAFSVAQRLQELSIRSALGATRERLIRLVLGEGLRLVAAGVLAGLAVALVAAPRIESLLFQVSPRDPITLGTAAAVLLFVAALAGAIPAWRATRADPGVALRAD